MIAFIEGEMVRLTASEALVNVNGIGYQVFLSLHTYEKIKGLTRLRLLTHFIVREDAQLLYGFADEEERQLFIHLLSVSGIGSNSARVILSSFSPEEIRVAIVTEDEALLQRIKGVGLKSAKKIILELKDKLRKETPDLAATASLTIAAPLREEALAALVQLGFPKPAVQKTLNAILKEQANINTVEQLIKAALKDLS